MGWGMVLNGIVLFYGQVGKYISGMLEEGEFL